MHTFIESRPIEALTISVTRTVVEKNKKKKRKWLRNNHTSEFKRAQWVPRDWARVSFYHGLYDFAVGFDSTWRTSRVHVYMCVNRCNTIVATNATTGEERQHNKWNNKLAHCALLAADPSLESIRRVRYANRRLTQAEIVASSLYAGEDKIPAKDDTRNEVEFPASGLSTLLFRASLL